MKIKDTIQFLPGPGNRARGMGIYFLLGLVAVLAALLVSCGEERPAAAEEEDFEINRRYQRGPVDLRIAISKKEITIAERVKMLIETRVREGYQVNLPGFGEKLEEFGIVDYSTPTPELQEDGVVVARRFYELEPFLSGDYRIPPMTVSFWQEGDTLQHTLQSDTILVRVMSILPQDLSELEIQDITGPVSLPASYRRLLIISAAGVLALALVVFFILRRRRREREVPPLRAHEIAFLRLERLLAEGLIDQKRYGEFTARVADILRFYIEDRFGLMAPERTTEEFIEEAGEGLPVDEKQKGILRDFLIHCDLVKFAALEPSADNVKDTFDTCRDFIDVTKMEEVKEEAA
ncbi:MAG: hypothetical protein JXB45_07475 [Candidatus Krumholzibacteriota bacterium]|nr:hypothetical protein [Candidatus Krumholzibacteriota bacterium]